MDISQNLYKNRSSKSKSHVWSQTKVCVLIEKNSWTDIFEAKQQQMTVFIRSFHRGNESSILPSSDHFANPVYLLQTCEYKRFKCAFYFPLDFKFLHQIGFKLNRNTATLTFVPAWGWGTHGSPSEGDLNQPGCCGAEPNSTDHRCCLSTTWPRDTYARLSWKNWALARIIWRRGEDLEASWKNRMAAKWRRLSQWRQHSVSRPSVGQYLTSSRCWPCKDPNYPLTGCVDPPPRSPLTPLLLPRSDR